MIGLVGETKMEKEKKTPPKEANKEGTPAKPDQKEKSEQKKETPAGEKPADKQPAKGENKEKASVLESGKAVEKKAIEAAKTSEVKERVLETKFEKTSEIGKAKTIPEAVNEAKASPKPEAKLETKELVTAPGAVKLVEGTPEKLDVLAKYGEPKLEGILKGKLEREFGPKVNITVTRKHRLFIAIAKEDILSVIKFLVDDGFPHLTTIASVDLGDKYELIYFLAGKNMIPAVRTTLPKDKPEIETITGIIPGATRYEREAMDLMGVVFLNHPDPRRLVLPDDWPEDVHPLRKDWQPPVVKGEGDRMERERALEKKGKEGVLWK